MSQKEDNPFLPDVEIAEETVSVSTIKNSFSSSLHPTACFFHVCFKIAAVVVYIFGGLVIDESLVQIITVLLLDAIDFYVVKNFSGRFLVGLRWWSIDGGEKMRFEKTNHPERVSKADSRIFWTVSIVITVVWGFFILTGMLGLRLVWLFVAGVGCALSGYNLYAYMQAAKDSKTVLSMFSFIPKAVTQKAVQSVSSAAMSLAKSALTTSTSAE